MPEPTISTHDLVDEIFKSDKGRFGLIALAVVERLADLGSEGRIAIQLAAEKEGDESFALGLAEMGKLVMPNDN
mgnify:CR=1 FL=1